MDQRVIRLPAASDENSAGRTCPWCSGLLELRSAYPILSLFPEPPGTAAIPELIHTAPAWVCQTPHCKYRARA
jgi:hypothetical protein